MNHAATPIHYARSYVAVVNRPPAAPTAVNSFTSPPGKFPLGTVRSDFFRFSACSLVV